MTRETYEVLRDVELIELLRDDPELLAIADAFAATQRHMRHARGRRPHTRAFASLAVAAAAVCALALLAPWRQGENPLLGRALAALDQQDVVHVIVRAHDPLNSVIDLATGRAEPGVIENESWFDETNERLHVITRRDGRIIADTISTRSGGSSSAGPVKIRPGQTVTLQPALADFVSGYRNALLSHTARVVNARQLADTSTQLIEYSLRGTTREQVEVDTATGRPLAFWTLAPSGRALKPRWRVVSISSIPLDPADFKKTRRKTILPANRSVIAVRQVSTATAAGVFARRALWAETRVGQLDLGAIQLQTLGNGSRVPDRARSLGLAFLYGTIPSPTLGASGRLQPYVQILEAPRPEPAYAFTAGGLSFNWYPLPNGGRLLLSELPRSNGTTTLWLGQLRQNNLYITIEGSTKQLVLDAARTLAPIRQE